MTYSIAGAVVVVVQVSHAATHGEVRVYGLASLRLAPASPSRIRVRRRWHLFCLLRPSSKTAGVIDVFCVHLSSRKAVT